MKKVLVALVVLGSFITQAEASNLPVRVYGGAGLVGSILNSKVKMHYTRGDGVNVNTAHRENHLGRVSGEMFLGVGSKRNNKTFWATEVSYNFSRHDHEHDFYKSKDQINGNPDPGPGRISYIDAKHGSELGFSLKVGRKVDAYDVYGILGVTNKKVEFKYGLDSSHRDIPYASEVNPSKRVTGLTFGIGAGKNLSEEAACGLDVTCGLEYKYKIYGSVKKGDVMPHYGWDRNFKDRSDKHEISFRVSVGM